MNSKYYKVSNKVILLSVVVLVVSCILSISYGYSQGLKANTNTCVCENK